MPTAITIWNTATIKAAHKHVPSDSGVCGLVLGLDLDRKYMRSMDFDA